MTDFLKKKGIEISFRRYGIDAMSAMAQGLFASLLIGTIISTIGGLLPSGSISEVLVLMGGYASGVKGAAMAIAIGHCLSAPNLVLYSLAAVGLAADSQGGAGGPLAIYVVTILSCEIGKLISKSTRLDILLTPLVTIGTGTLLSVFFAPYIGSAASWIGNLIMWATELHPFIMGILVSVIVGILLTLPISSAAICASFGLTGLAGGAALAGCCAQMIGFAVISYKENKLGGLLSQGIGTSMLQMGNIIKKPVIWLPIILISAITGPISTCIFKLQMNGEAISSGMGTCGLVGQIGVYTGWVNDISSGAKSAITAIDWIGLLLISFVLPIVLAWIFGIVSRKIGLIKDGDLKLDL